MLNHIHIVPHRTGFCGIFTFYCLSFQHRLCAYYWNPFCMPWGSRPHTHTHSTLTYTLDSTPALHLSSHCSALLENGKRRNGIRIGIGIGIGIALHRHCPHLNCAQNKSRVENCKVIGERERALITYRYQAGISKKRRKKQLNIQPTAPCSMPFLPLDNLDIYHGNAAGVLGI